MDLMFVFKIALSCMLSFSVGWFGVNYLRLAVIRTDKTWKVTLWIFVSPISIYISLHAISSFGLLDHVIADSISFAIVLGILASLNITPKGENTVKLVAVNQITGKYIDVWLKSTDVLVGEARNKIAEKLNVTPASRVCIESGQGQFIENLNDQLFPIISADDSTTVMDFFGYVTASCCIFVKEEERMLATREGGDIRMLDKSSRRGSFMSHMLSSRTEAKYGDLFTVTAKSRSCVSDTNIFQVHKIDKFVGASPTTLHQHFTGVTSSSHVRFISWTAYLQMNNMVDTVSIISGPEGRSSIDAGADEDDADSDHPKASSNKKVPGDGMTIKNGDIVLLETDGMFMSVTKGWWLAWSSNTPRRSGAFIVEILERAPQQSLSEQFSSRLLDIKEKIGRPSISLGAVGNIGGMETLGAIGALAKTDLAGPLSLTAAAAGSSSVTGNALSSNIGSLSASADNVLRTGDYFRLRSVKFPDFELGVTTDRIRDEYCYIGLRKIDESVSSNDWCSSVAFSIKANYLSSEMSKMHGILKRTTNH